ncbi:NAD(P)-dependent oxidoreductase [Pueribacillus theae]|uniref:NAD(P)-dependent oxidoreductase n=1 Tax=Pueribacillus theae TaxID=2171751 RepID=A0A2U1K7W5_9BACI|nr:NAD(P)-dependent oxidoreductase [Pueribacillus theae]PWA13249.1 NAD(P)-dependent oxidoreductase [Pueribacillus theae]
MKIGFIGLGVMGSRMTKRLLAAGFSVIVYNRTKEKMKEFVKLGAEAAESISELSEKANVICTCLSMPSDVNEVYEEVIQHAKPETICLDFTTVGMDTSQTMGEKAKKKGMIFLDAPISGGPEGAEEGTLTIMVGGDEPSYEKVFPVLNALGGNIQHLGQSGMGSVAKLMNQYLVAVHSLAASEAMVVGTALGLKSDQLYNILKTSYGDSRMLRRHMEHYVLDRQFEPGGAVKYVHKDVKLANQLMNQAGLKVFTGNMAQDAFNTAIHEGLADEDMSAVIKPLEKQAGAVVARNKA